MLDMLFHMFLARWRQVSAPSRPHIVSLLTRDTISAKMCSLLKTDNVSVADDVDNALRINAHFKYTNPIVISENTVGFKLNFATTRGVSLDAGQDSANKIFMTKKIYLNTFTPLMEF